MTSMDTPFPPPHYLLFEPLNDIETTKFWKKYKEENDHHAEFTEIDAAEINSVDTFSPWFDTWIAQTPSKRSSYIRILLIYHSEFLTFSCQQMLRRSLEQRSFKCRVWFHVEDPTVIQAAIQSRTIIKRIPTYVHYPTIKEL
jgi:DNA polymerase III delta prime subunit